MLYTNFTKNHFWAVSFIHCENLTITKQLVCVTEPDNWKKN